MAIWCNKLNKSSRAPVKSCPCSPSSPISFSSSEALPCCNWLTISTTLPWSMLPNIWLTADSVKSPPQKAMAWSVKLKASRILPLAARPNCHKEASAKAMVSLVSTCRKWPATCSAGMFLRLNCKHLDSTVMGSFCGSVVANKNFTWGGGSSKVLSKALKLLVESMCTSSIR